MPFANKYNILYELYCIIRQSAFCVWNTVKCQQFVTNINNIDVVKCENIYSTLAGFMANEMVEEQLNMFQVKKVQL